MARPSKTSKRFYKYRAFDSRTVEALIEDEVYFADPSTFNDPLDTRPTLEADLAAEEMKRVFLELAERRIAAEMRKGAQLAKFKGPKTTEHIEKRAKGESRRLLGDIEYHATDSESYGPLDEALAWLLKDAIQDELLRQNDKGIFCLSERFASPLLWSHYADQHRGLCIGYSVPADAKLQFHKVDYQGGRLVKCSDLAAMLAGDMNAKRKVDDAVLLRKAPDWRYEREWRLVGQRGSQGAPLELETVTFGMRCSSAVKFAVVSSLAERRRPLRFYEMHEVSGSFQLKRRSVDVVEMTAHYPRRYREIMECFAPVVDTMQ